MWGIHLTIPQKDGTSVTVKLPKLYADITLLTPKSLLKDAKELGVRLRRRGNGIDEKMSHPPGKEARAALKAVFAAR